MFLSFSVEICWYFDMAASLVANHESVSTKCVNCRWKSIHLFNEILRDSSLSFSDDVTCFQSSSSHAIDCLKVTHFSSSMFSFLDFRLNTSSFSCLERNSRLPFCEKIYVFQAASDDTLNLDGISLSLLSSSLIGERISQQAIAQLIVDPRYLRFNVLIREDAKV